jgi:septum formation protein
VALDDGRILGKPSGPGEAAAHLRALSGTTHSVVTGVCLREVPGGGEEVFHSLTRVTMRPLAEAEIAAYARSGEGLDKAGGYALQEGGDRFVVRIEGSRSNVVGLPVEEVLARLASRGIRP